MIFVDTSVLVAGFGGWHARHDEAREIVEQTRSVVGHAALECLSVLTRLPGDVRAGPEQVVRWLESRFPDRWLTLPPDDLRRVPAALVEAGVDGGAVYDGLIALTVAWTGGRLVSFDRRAGRTYERCGVRVEFV